MIALDTHVLVWWLSDPGRLSATALNLIEREAQESRALAVSSISVWEIAMLVARGRLTLSISLEDWIAHAEQVDALQYVPVTNRIAIRATQLPEPLHSDPADRMIIATARDLGCPLVTADSRIRNYAHVDTVW